MEISEQKRKGRGGTVISFLFFMFIGAGAGISMFPALDYILSGEGNMFIGIVAILMMISLMYVALILEMAIHELGHLFFRSPYRIYLHILSPGILPHYEGGREA